MEPFPLGIGACVLPLASEVLSVSKQACRQTADSFRQRVLDAIQRASREGNTTAAVFISSKTIDFECVAMIADELRNLGFVATAQRDGSVYALDIDWDWEQENEERDEVKSE